MSTKEYSFQRVNTSLKKLQVTIQADEATGGVKSKIDPGQLQCISANYSKSRTREFENPTTH